jgi:NodT family efflux transporter outer membrane factor (OMF) lipoprotein
VRSTTPHARSALEDFHPTDHPVAGSTAGRARHRTGSRTLAATLLGALVLSGCTKLGPEFVRPETKVNADWQPGAESPAESRVKQAADADYTRWWQAFGDPVLDQLIETAYRQNLSLQAAGVRILEARAQLGIAVGGLYPQQQQATGEALYNKGSKNVANTAAGGDFNFWNYGIGLGAAWELDIWGRFQRSVESADANVLASIANYDDVLVSLTAEVANAYVIIRTFEERLAIARANVEIQERSLQIADVRFRNGATTELDVQQARTLLANTRATIPDLEAGLQQARNALSTLLGLPPSRWRRATSRWGFPRSCYADARTCVALSSRPPPRAP